MLRAFWCVRIWMVYTYICVCVCMGTCACGQIGGQGGCCMSRSITYRLIPLEQGLSLNLERGWWIPYNAGVTGVHLRGYA